MDSFSGEVNLKNRLLCSPIGIFDSGVGGLTVFKAIKEQFPNESIVYFGDTYRVPYGTKSEGLILQCAMQDINFLKSLDVKMIIVACGTVSSYFSMLDFGGVPAVGVIEPSCDRAVKMTKNLKIGVMCTPAAQKSGSYEKSILKLLPGAKIFVQACPDLVPLIEGGIICDSDPRMKRAIEKYTQMLIKNKVDTIILGCTHYPIIKKAIKNVIGDGICLVDTGEETARFVKAHSSDYHFPLANDMVSSYDFFVSANENKFSQSAKMFLGCDVSKKIKKIDITKY